MIVSVLTAILMTFQYIGSEIYRYSEEDLENYLNTRDFVEETLCKKTLGKVFGSDLDLFSYYISTYVTVSSE